MYSGTALIKSLGGDSLRKPHICADFACIGSCVETAKLNCSFCEICVKIERSVTRAVIVGITAFISVGISVPDIC